MPTIKQKKAFDKLVGNGGNITKAMREVKYSENTLNTPQKLTESVGFQELLKEYLPDELLQTKHKELLNKVDDNGKLDTQAVKSALNMAYKLKGAYAPEKRVNVNANVNINKQHEEIADKYEGELRDNLIK